MSMLTFLKSLIPLLPGSEFVPRIINGRIYSPFFIFIRKTDKYSDEDLMKLFGLTGYRRVSTTRSGRTYFSITEDDEWIHVADDWLYTLWNDPQVRQAIEEIGGNTEIFVCSVGDCDPEPYDFRYVRDGELLRKFEVDVSGETTCDIGAPLEGEAEAMKHREPMDTLLDLARSLGIQLNHKKANIRCYGKKQK